MSSNIEIQRICQYCNNEFTARTTRTKYCSHKCNSRHYKARKRNAKVEVSNRQTLEKRSTPINEVRIKEYLTVQDAAILIGCSTKTVYRLIQDGKLNAINLGTRLTRITKAEIEKLITTPKSQRVNNEVKTPQPVNYSIKDCCTVAEAQKKYGISPSGLRLLLIRNKVPKIKDGKYTYIPIPILNRLLT